MRFLGTTARRIVYAIFITALLPLVSALLISRAIIARVSATAFQPEFGQRLDQSLGVYADLAKALKQTMRAEAQAIAAREPLRLAAIAKNGRAVESELDRALAAHPSLRQIRIETCSGARIAAREHTIDAKAERSLVVRRAIGSEDGEDLRCNDERPDEPLILEATFAAPRARLDEREDAQAFAQAYHQMESVHRDVYLDRSYGNSFAALFVVTLLLAVGVGVLVARPVTQRIARLAAATRPVAEGDLTVRVGLEGDDEVADLGRAFDRMLEELERSRARVEFLRRMSEWQQVARRLAHEIKNPLTPIQLAVEETHRRYRGDDAEYKLIVETMAEIVSEEIGTLRRLCTEFSSFARLPRAKLEAADLGAFLKEQGAHFAALGGGDTDAALYRGVDVAFDIPDEPMPAAIDREMLHRVLVNVMRNAAQAMAGARSGRALRGGLDTPPGGGNGRTIRVSARCASGHYVVLVDDDGPGVPDAVKDAIFDPYVTTKRDGTGLGLSIVKKIVVDHGGSVDTLPSPLGGARFRITIPCHGTAEARAAIELGERGDASPPSSARR